MTTSRDPGVLGCYGFRNRVDYSYDHMAVASGAIIKAKRVWDFLSEAGKECVVIGVPQTYPLRPINGHMVGGLLTPGIESAFTYPAVFKQEVLNVAPNYTFDVADFRTEDKFGLLKRIIDMTELQHKVVMHTLKSKPWDFFMYVNIGVDRMHHGFWRYHDPQHRYHDPNSLLVSAIRDYYKLADRLIGEVVEAAGDDVIVLVVSDHGVSRMDGGICVNEWLWRNGWLALKAPPKDGLLLPFEQAEIDWAHTKAWASGGYYGRIAFNVQGREPQGIIPPGHYEVVREELATQLAAIPGPEGERLNTQVFKPQAVYREVRNIAPDLLVYFGDLHWRAVGSFGHGRHYTFENDTGPDDANHAIHGLFILCEPKRSSAGRVIGHQLMDVTPTILHRMGMSIPSDMQGRVMGY
jgi:predicted AlkP superfamily phosphohydrolase/phosphomutase